MDPDQVFGIGEVAITEITITGFQELLLHFKELFRIVPGQVPFLPKIIAQAI